MSFRGLHPLGWGSNVDKEACGLYSRRLLHAKNHTLVASIAFHTTSILARKDHGKYRKIILQLEVVSLLVGAANCSRNEVFAVGHFTPRPQILRS